MQDWELQDDWRRDQTARYNSYPPPDVPIWDFSAGESCVCLKINTKWIPFISGLIGILLDPVYWQTSDPEFPETSIAELITALHGESILMNCDPAEFIKGISFEGGVLTVTFGDDSTQEVAGTDQIVTGIGAIGDGWEVEQNGQFTAVPNEAGCGDCEAYPDTPVMDKSGAGRSCAIAINLTDWIFDRYNDVIDQVELYNDAVKAVGSALRYFPPAYIIYESCIAVVNDMIDVGISAARAADTVEMREAFMEALYCAVRDNGDTLDVAAWQGFKSDYVTGIAPLLEAWVGTVEDGAIVSEAHKASYGEEAGCETFACGVCFNRILDFTVTPECSFARQVTSGNYPNMDWADWEQGFGWRRVVLTGGGAGSGQFNRIQLYVDLGETKTVTDVRYVWSIVTGAPSQELVLSAPNGSPTNFTTRYTGNNAAGEKSFSGSFDCRYLLFVLEQSASDPPAVLPDGDWYLEEVEVTTS